MYVKEFVVSDALVLLVILYGKIDISKTKI